MSNPLSRAARLLVRAVRRFGTDDGMIRAAALSYTTLLSLVPFLAVFFALLSAFGRFIRTEARLEAFLLAHLLPSSASAATEYLTRFTRNTAAIGVIGFVFLLLTALLMLNAIETAFRHIYRLPEGRSIRQRLLSYWTMLTVSPLLLGLSIYVSGTARRLGPLAESAGLVGAVYLWSYLTPLFITWGAFTLAYLVLPATSVRLRAAAAGAFVAALLWEIAKAAFDWYIRQYASFERLYGALALVPIFLLWINLSWIIILLGAEVAFCVQYPEPDPAGDRPAGGRPAPGPLAARLFWIVARDFAAGRGRPTAEAIAGELQVDVEAVESAAARLERAGLVARVPDPADADAPAGFLPARPLASVTVAEVVRAGEVPGGGLAEGAESGSPVLGLLAAAEVEASAVLEGATYGALAEQWRASQAGAAALPAPLAGAAAAAPARLGADPVDPPGDAAGTTVATADPTERRR